MAWTPLQQGTQVQKQAVRKAIIEAIKAFKECSIYKGSGPSIHLITKANVYSINPIFDVSINEQNVKFQFPEAEPDNDQSSICIFDVDIHDNVKRQ